MQLEQRGLLRGTWGTTDTNRKARFYGLTAAGRRELTVEKQAWDRMAAIMHALFDRNLVSAFTCGTECTITQTSKTLTIKRPADAQGVAPPVVILNLDGSNSKHQQAGRNGGLPSYVARANWSGNTLVVTREHGQGQVVTTQTLSLQGGKLTIAYSVNLDVTGLPTLIYTKK